MQPWQPQSSSHCWKVHCQPQLMTMGGAVQWCHRLETLLTKFPPFTEASILIKHGDLHTLPGPAADQLPIHTNIAVTAVVLALAPEGMATASTNLVSLTSNTAWHMGQTGKDKQTSRAISAAASAYLTSVPIASNMQSSIIAVALALASEGMATASINLVSLTSNTAWHMGQTGKDKQTSRAISATTSVYLTSVPITSNK